MSPQTTDFQLEPAYDQLVDETGFDPAASAERVYAEFALPKGTDGMTDPERDRSLAAFAAGVGSKDQTPNQAPREEGPTNGPTRVIPRHPGGPITPLWRRR